MDPKVDNTHMCMGKTKNCKKCAMKFLRISFRTRNGHENNSDTGAISSSNDHDLNQNIKPSSKAIIYSSELEYIARCINDYPDIETGGQLFGAWTASGVPRIVYAIGPGPNASHESVSFSQDVDYLLSVGAKLREYGLQHIGEWHSHHKLGLSHPSGHDANNMQGSIEQLNLNRLCLFIGNILETGAIAIHPFNFVAGEHYVEAQWDVITDKNQLRNHIDSDLAELLIHPQSNSFAFAERYFTPKTQPIEHLDSWFGVLENRQKFKVIIEKLKAQTWINEVCPKISQDGVISLKISGIRFAEIITFPNDFPNSPFTVQRMSFIENEESKYTPTDWIVSSDDSIIDVFTNNYNNYLKLNP
jgi:hypothetical protein